MFTIYPLKPVFANSCTASNYMRVPIPIFDDRMKYTFGMFVVSFNDSYTFMVTHTCLYLYVGKQRGGNRII